MQTQAREVVLHANAGKQGLRKQKLTGEKLQIRAITISQRTNE